MSCLPPRLRAVPLTAALLVLSQPANATDPLELRVTPTIANEPANLRIVAYVERHPDNRWLVIEADALTFYRASHRQLDGEYAARAHSLLLTDLPAGRYTITVRVSGESDVRAEAECDVRVIGATDDR